LIMGVDSGFIDYLLELLAPLGNVRARRMFGGCGIYHGQVMFGLVADDTLYLKVDEASSAEYAAQRLEPFVYVKNGKPIRMSYRRAPDEALEDTEMMCEWAQRALAVAVREQAKKAEKRA
jgi:DNA transformation protein and related proteins